MSSAAPSFDSKTFVDETLSNELLTKNEARKKAYDILQSLGDHLYLCEQSPVLLTQIVTVELLRKYKELYIKRKNSSAEALIKVFRDVTVKDFEEEWKKNHTIMNVTAFEIALKNALAVINLLHSQHKKKSSTEIDPEFRDKIASDTKLLMEEIAGPLEIILTPVFPTACVLAEELRGEEKLGPDINAIWKKQGFLDLYGLYMQSNYGDNKASEPKLGTLEKVVGTASLVVSSVTGIKTKAGDDVLAAEKSTGWNNFLGMPKGYVMYLYCRLVHDILKQFVQHQEVEKLLKTQPRRWQHLIQIVSDTISSKAKPAQAASKTSKGSKAKPDTLPWLKIELLNDSSTEVKEALEPKTMLAKASIASITLAQASIDTNKPDWKKSIMHILQLALKNTTLGISDKTKAFIATIMKDDAAFAQIEKTAGIKSPKTGGIIFTLTEADRKQLVESISLDQPKPDRGDSKTLADKFNVVASLSALDSPGSDASASAASSSSASTSAASAGSSLPTASSSDGGDSRPPASMLAAFSEFVAQQSEGLKQQPAAVALEQASGSSKTHQMPT